MQEAIKEVAADSPKVKFTPENLSRFWSKVYKDGPIIIPELGSCWMWTSTRNKAGYGVIGISQKNYLTHRLSWEIQNGTIPKDLLVLHKCDNPSCINPEHLFLGTDADNVCDKMNKGRHRKRSGEATGTAKVTKEQVIEIRERFAQGGIHHSQIAKEFGLSRMAVSFIVRRRTWKHI